MSKATDDAKAERDRLLGNARKAADALGAARREGLQTEARNLNQVIQRRVQQEVFAVARKALADLSSVGLEERMCEIFTRRLRAIDGKVKVKLADALKAAAEKAIVRSAFELSEPQRAAIQNALDETFSTQIQLSFEIAPDMVSGIELTAGGQKMAWSIGEYLASLENDINALLSEKEGPSPMNASVRPTTVTPGSRRP